MLYSFGLFLTISSVLGFPGGSDSKESTCNVGDLGLILGLGRFPGEGNGCPLQYSCLENSTDRGAWWTIVHGLSESDTTERLLLTHSGSVVLIPVFSRPRTCYWRRQWHSSTLAWKIPWMEEPGRLQSIGLLRVRHNWATSLSLFTFVHGRRKWQPTPVFLPGESQGREPHGLLSMGSHRVGHDWRDLAAAVQSGFWVEWGKKTGKI